MVWFLVGILTCLDGYMNIVLGQTEEYLNGQVSGLKNHQLLMILFCINFFFSALLEIFFKWKAKNIDEFDNRSLAFVIF